MQKAAIPAVFFGIATFVVMSVWTATDDVQWKRVEINSYNGDSIGKCYSDHMGIFILAIALVALVPLVLTGVMAWKTRDVDEAYSESSWIFALIVLQLELIVLAFPVIAILRNLSSDGRYVGFVIVLWIFPMSTLVFIMLPKYLAFSRASKDSPSPSDSTTGTAHRKRGQRTIGTRISGLHIVSNEARKTPMSSLEEISVAIAGDGKNNKINSHEGQQTSGGGSSYLQKGQNVPQNHISG